MYLMSGLITHETLREGIKTWNSRNFKQEILEHRFLALALLVFSKESSPRAVLAN